MPVTCVLLDKKYRIVGPNGEPELNEAGSAVDGGGHDELAACEAQARAINASLAASIVYFGQSDLDGFKLSNEKDRLYRKELIYVGNFVKDGMRFSVTEDTLAHWLATFTKFKAKGIEVPLPVEHTSSPLARRGEVVEMELGVNTRGKPALFGFVRFRDMEAEKLAASQTSIYVPPEFTDGEGTVYKHPIMHVALTDYPVVPGLGRFHAIAASFEAGDKPVSLKSLAEKLGVKIDGEANDDSITTAITSAFSSLKAKVKELTDKAAASPAKVEPKPIAAGFLALARKNRDLELEGLVRDGKVTPAVRDELKKVYCTDESLALSLQDVDPDTTFDKVILALSKMDVVTLGEQTGPQGNVVALSKNGKDEDNPLLADAKGRAEAAK